jgi:hypothetical protein
MPMVLTLVSVQWTGTALSIVAFIGMVFLVWAEYTEFATITPESRLICKLKS